LGAENLTELVSFMDTQTKSDFHRKLIHLVMVNTLSIPDSQPFRNYVWVCECMWMHTSMYGGGIGLLSRRSRMHKKVELEMACGWGYSVGKALSTLAQVLY